jgi:hypothetical protein
MADQIQIPPPKRLERVPTIHICDTPSNKRQCISAPSAPQVTPPVTTSMGSSHGLSLLKPTRVDYVPGNDMGSTLYNRGLRVTNSPYDADYLDFVKKLCENPEFPTLQNTPQLFSLLYVKDTSPNLWNQLKHETNNAIFPTIFPPLDPTLSHLKNLIPKRRDLSPRFDDMYCYMNYDEVLREYYLSKRDTSLS